MSTHALPPGERYRIYGLPEAKLLAFQASLRGRETSFVEHGVDAFLALIVSTPGVGEAFRQNGVQLRVILADHFRAVITGVGAAKHEAHAENTMRHLAENGSDMRAVFACANHVTVAFSAWRTRGAFGHSRRAVGDVEILQRLLFCDCGTAIAVHQKEMERQSGTRNAVLTRLVADFSGVLEQATADMRLASGDVRAAADRVGDAASGAGDSSRVAAMSADQSNANLTSSAASTEELSHATAALESRTRAAQGAVDSAESAVTGARAAMADLHAAADRIGSIVGLISTIAEQTNLLALNATIEAARAGDAGRGFAVVAQEVKALASQTTRATQDIVQQIRAVQDGSSRSVREIEEIGSAMSVLSGHSGEVAAAVSQQNALTAELARTLNETVREVVATSDGYSRALEMVGQTAEEAAQMGARMAALDGISTSLDSAIRDFSARAKAA
jgi:methyl-accepting chemotaxis protein